ncbi:MAG: hypothetical protein H7211_05575 [Aquabacterium sp.]|nr:hypothetical protein [Ferruginibacter sp.]
MLSALVYSCAQKISILVILKQLPLAPGQFVLVLQQQDQFINDGIEPGTIIAGNNGFSTNCTYSEVIAPLKEPAVKRS